MSEEFLTDEKKAKLLWWTEQGVEPFGRRFEKEDIGTILIKKEGVVSTAGRIMTMRRHGKAAFADLSDWTGKVQIYCKKDILGDMMWERFRNLDIGDIIGVSGELFLTHTGQLTILVKDFSLLSKILRTMPEKWHGLRDVEIRYRKRYLDLMMNREVQKIFLMRAKTLSCMRRYLDEEGFLEVETPMMHPIAGGAEAKPFVTHHHALGINLFLRIAPELYLKRLLVGGLEKVYEINRSFRNEGISTLHNPEFTMLEAYYAYGDCETMMDLTEQMLVAVADEVCGGTMQYGGKEISLARPWKRIEWEGCWKMLGVEDWRDVSLVKKRLAVEGIETDVGEGLFDLLDLLFKRKMEKDLVEPTFLVGFPTEISPLAKNRVGDSSITERFELYIGGMEVANAYSELNDPIDQKKRFQQEVAVSANHEKSLDEEYIEALEFAMPPAGGLGIGIDRLMMLLTGSASIRDVLLFPQLKPKP